MKNKFEVRGDITAIFLKSKKHGLLETIIDTIDLQRAQEFPGTWIVYKDPKIKDFYCSGSITLESGKRKTVKLHRWVLEAPDDKQVDHYDNNTLRNLRSNLRIATLAENNQNKAGAYQNSKSGIRGVCWHKQRKKWIAHIRINRERIYLGLFENIEDAVEVVKKARAEYMPFSKEANREDVKIGN